LIDVGGWAEDDFDPKDIIRDFDLLQQKLYGVCMADAAADLLRRKLTRENLESNAQLRFSGLLKYVKALRHQPEQPQFPNPPKLLTEDEAYQQLFNLLEAPATKLAKDDVRFQPDHRVFYDFTRKNRKWCEEISSSREVRQKRLRTEGPLPSYDWDRREEAAPASKTAISGILLRGSPCPTTPGSPAPAAQETAKVSGGGASVLVDANKIPILKSTKDDAIKSFITALFPLMQHADQRRVVKLRERVPDQSVANELVKTFCPIRRWLSTTFGTIVPTSMSNLRSTWN
jgi:hypothetical protein